ncbi:acyltransferase family protein [Streptomyces wuyuanensis]|uniref:Acyltransferase family protein n=1 Tax=Streptomyces wuyuanensis TaxID=1196353 RepID=A0A1G9V0U3_9ACTN|nr:acyltransferase [Streptomyces wuyuanensis]SDM65690.1 Acyltransferase family protein [Streptomyces wuyuanensis]
MGSRVRTLAEATPDTRDRYVDLLRVVSLGTVVLGHWLMAAVTADGVGNLLAVVPELQLLTWALQIMPVFFFVGGFSHALSYRSLRRRHPADDGVSLYAAFLRARLRRLLRPTMVFVLVWGVAALLVQLLGGGGGLTGVSLRLVTQPLWFIGIYLAMVAFTPPLLRLHERYGWGAFGALVAGAVLVDVLRFALGVPFVEFLNFAFVWLAVHQLGFLRADGRLRLPSALAATGLAGAALLVAAGPYPLSMVGMPGEKVSNMAPPTLALLCHGLWLVGAVELLRAPGARLVARPRVWRTVVAANGVAMTAFLWHLTAMLGVYGALLAAGVTLPEPASAAWWAQTPLRIAAAALLTAVLVAVFRGFEQPSPAPVRPGSGPLAALGITLCLFGVLGLSMVGFAGLLDGRTATLVAVPVSAPAAVAMALAGWWLVERSGFAVRRDEG